MESARRGVVRVLDFVDQLVVATELANEPSTTCDLAAIVSESLERIEGSERVVLQVPEAPVQLRAPRHRLVLAIVNLVRNAVQSSPVPAPILIVDDDREFVAIYRELLEGQGLGVDVAFSSEDAVGCLQARGDEQPQGTSPGGSHRAALSCDLWIRARDEPAAQRRGRDRSRHRPSLCRSSVARWLGVLGWRVQELVGAVRRPRAPRPFTASC